jgi:signal transduction histidine kinase
MEPKEGGVLVIETRRSSKDGHVLIRVQDTGVGIPEEHMPRLFEPFFTTRKGKGVGLGLSVVYGIVQEHGGSIEVTSHAGEGTTFSVKLPIHPMSAKRKSEGDDREFRQDPDRR